MAPRVPGGNNTKPSCVKCPQHLDDQSQLNILGKGIGHGICPLKLLAIGRPGVETKHPESQAKKCDSYGTPRASFKDDVKTLPIELKVAFPDLTIVGDPNEPERVGSCVQCDHWVPSGVVMKKMGWRTAYCKAKGALILDDRLSKYAATCASRSRRTTAPISEFDPSSMANLSINLLPEYREGYGKVNPLALLRQLKEGGGEPSEYPTDKRVSPKAASLGVRAWRRIRDQKGNGSDVFLPVFDISQILGYQEDQELLEIEQSKIPKTGDDEHPEWYVDHGNFVYKTVVLWTMLNETPALWGPPGVGKTELFRHLAWMMVLPFERISITGSSELDDIAGKMMYTPERGTFFHLGRIPRAWSKPNVLCIDEPNVGPPDVWQFLRPLTDNSKQLVLDQDKGQRIAAHTACYLGMAMNPAWDPRNVGAMALGDADGSRLMHIHMSLPPEPIEREIIKTRCMADRRLVKPEDKDRTEKEVDGIIDTMMQIAPELRRLSEDGVIPVSWGIRDQIKVARAKPYMSWKDAYRIGVADALEPQAQEAVLDIVGNYCEEDD